MKKIGILGSTGSIGTQTLEIVRSNPDLQVIALAAGSNVSLMEQQVREFHPMLAVMGSEEAATDLKNRIADTDTRVSAGMEGMLGACNSSADGGFSNSDCRHDRNPSDDCSD